MLVFAPQNGKFKADLTFNYQKDDNSGTSFMSKSLNAQNGENNIFKFKASFDENKTFYNKRDVLGTILNARFYKNDNNYLSSITSYFKNKTDTRFDGDGSIAPAIDMAELGKANQFMQEFRYNYSFGKITGIAGASFWQENVNHLYTFRPGEQYLAAMMMQFFMPELIPSDYQLFLNNKPNPLPSLVVPGYLLNLPFDMKLDLPEYHVEDNYTEAVNSSYDLFFDASYKILPKLSVTTGIRATLETFTITNRARFVEGETSVLGMMSGRSPNFFFKPVDNPERKEKFSAFTWRVALKYELDERSNIYFGYAKGRRPNVLQYDATGKYEVIEPEILHSFDAGYRIVSYKFMIDASLFYQKYKNFQSWKWEGMDYLQSNVDKATLYGIEFSFRYMLNNFLNFFGNYTYIFTKFDDKDNAGNPQFMANNSFRLTPRNSFLLGFTGSFDVTNNVCISLTPTYSWKSHFFFEDANDAGIEQDAFGLLNANLSLRLKKQRLSISLFGSNLTDENFLIGAGNMGAMFGVPTFVPGAPRTVGIKLVFIF